MLHGALGQRAEGVPGIICRWVERVSLPLLQDVLQQLVQHVTCGGETQKVKGHLLSSPTAREIWGLRHPLSPIPPTSPSSSSLICSPGGWKLEQYWKKRERPGNVFQGILTRVIVVFLRSPSMRAAGANLAGALQHVITQSRWPHLSRKFTL